MHRPKIPTLRRWRQEDSEFHYAWSLRLGWITWEGCVMEQWENMLNIQGILVWRSNYADIFVATNRWSHGKAITVIGGNVLSKVMCERKTLWSNIFTHVRGCWGDGSASDSTSCASMKTCKKLVWPIAFPVTPSTFTRWGVEMWGGGSLGLADC